MNIKVLVGIIVGLVATTVYAAESRHTVYQQDGFSAEAVIDNCGDSCGKQMAVIARYEFTFSGDYATLLATLQTIGLRVSVYDGEWSDANAGDVVMKVSSTIHQRQRWRRANLRRKMETPDQMASMIYATLPVGTLITLEFQQDPYPLQGDDFTINVRRYASETLVSSGSKAFTPVETGWNTDTREP